MTEKDEYQLQLHSTEATAKCDPSTTISATAIATSATAATTIDCSGQGEQAECSDDEHVGHDIKHISGVLNVDDLYALPNKNRNKNRVADADVVPECTSSDEGGDEKGGHEDAEDKDANKDLPPGWEKHEGESDEVCQQKPLQFKSLHFCSHRHQWSVLLAHQIGHHSARAARLVQAQQQRTAATCCTGCTCGSTAAAAAGPSCRAADAVCRLHCIDGLLLDGRLDQFDEQLLQPDGQQRHELGNGASVVVAFTGAQTQQAPATTGRTQVCNR